MHHLLTVLFISGGLGVVSAAATTVTVARAEGNGLWNEEIGHIVDIFGFIAPQIPWVIPPVALAAGPGRALSLWLKPMWRFRKAPSTVREDLLQDLRDQLKTLTGDQYIVVYGPKGVGKTHLINAALKWAPGVMSFDVMPHLPATDILDSVLAEVSRMTLGRRDAASARVLRILRIFGCRPIVVLHAGERAPADNPAGIAAAVKSLTSTHKLRVIVDASENSIDANVLGTTRQHAIHVGELSRDQLILIPEVENAIARLKEDGLEEAAWHLFGGIPSLYLQPEKPLKVMQEQLRIAVERINNMRKFAPEATRILDQFKGSPINGMSIHKDHLPPSVLDEDARRRFRVFRPVDDDLVPATPALRLALHLGLLGEYRAPTTPQGFTDLVSRIMPTPTNGQK